MANPMILRLAELQARQALRAAGAGPLQIPTDEIAAVKRVAIATFGEGHNDRGAVIEIVASDPGVFRVGHFTAPRDPRDRADRNRPRRILFRARTHGELLEQVRLWRSRI